MFDKLCYPRHFVDRAFSRAKSRFYNPLNERQKSSFKNTISLPFHHKLLPAKKLVSNKKEGIQLVFNYENSLASKFVHNKGKLGDNDIAV